MENSANTYTPYFLKFTSEAEAKTVLSEAGFLRTYEDPITSNPVEYYSVADTPSAPGDVNIVGEIYNNDGVYSDPDPTTGEITLISSPTLKDGWHVNLILVGGLPPLLVQYTIFPLTPNRKFAGF